METFIPTSISGIRNLFELNTRLYHNVLTDITAEQSQLRLSGQTNHIRWIAGHMLSSRYAVAGLTGANITEPFPDLFANGKGLDPEGDYPELAAYSHPWSTISNVLSDQLEAVSEEALNNTSPIRVPMPQASLLATIAFFAHHETYHLGQLGLLRRSFGLLGMAYG